jgi:hypothetical protein
MGNNFCPECGHPAQREEPAEAVAEAVAVGEVTDSAVRIAEIESKTAIALARIQAGMVDVEQVAELAHAEGVAEGLTAAVSPPEPESAPEPPAEPIVVVDDQEPEPEMPPAEHRAPAGQHRKPAGFFGGM